MSDNEVYICYIIDNPCGDSLPLPQQRARVVILGTNSITEMRKLFNCSKRFSLEVHHVPKYDQLNFNFYNDTELHSNGLSVL